jgi:uncharacterized protein YndB with AHSA1/START domain
MPACGTRATSQRVADRPHPDQPGRPGITITRIFDAPPADVWKEWTEPERFADWFGGPDGDVPIETVAMDVRPGGTWRMTMFAGPNRRRIDWHGVFVEVDAPRRLVFTINDQPGSDDDEPVTVVLIDLGDARTEMHFEQRGKLSPEQYRRAESGWSGFFDRLAERLAGG